MRVLLIALGMAAIAPQPAEEPRVRWGNAGHEMAARAAVATLPTRVPDFFRAAGEQLVYLDPEPDRWRVRSLTEMDRAFEYDHFIDLENVPEGALDARDRFQYLRRLYAAGLARPENDAGFLPFRIVELYGRLLTEWRLWRRETDPTRRRWIQERIINDAGILGHYVTDGAQPHHTTIHYNGWARGVANPEGFTEDRTFHARFESDFVAAHVTQAEVTRRTEPPRPLNGSAREAVMAFLQTSHALVEEIYRLDRDIGFNPDGPPRPETVDFATERLASGAGMLSALWLAAWEESG